MPRAVCSVMRCHVIAYDSLWLQALRCTRNSVRFWVTVAMRVTMLVC